MAEIYSKGKIKHHISNIKNNIIASANMVQGLFNEFGVDLGLGTSTLFKGPIGLGSKNYVLMQAMLNKSIGSHQFGFDGYGTPIGMFGNPYLNSEFNPWFMLDDERKKYSDYLSYVNRMYFQGTMLPPNFQSQSDRINIFDYNELLEENARVGVIRGYNMDNLLSARLLIPNGQTNPNGYDDTRLGVINNFYLSGALFSSLNKSLNREKTNNITAKLYDNFGIQGKWGMTNNTFGVRKGMVMPQKDLTDEIIFSSTTDQEFGNYYDMNGSLHLFNASSNRTKELITKSMYGIDLLSDETVPLLDNSNLNLDYIKKNYKKKYFITANSRGTNYIDAMTENEHNIEDLDGAKNVRFSFQDIGNDNLSAFNTFLVYEEYKTKTDNSNGSLITGNYGVAVGHYQTYDSKSIKNKKDIIEYTNRQFQTNKFKTIIGRFHTDGFKDENDSRINRDYTSSAVSKYGMSRGRNLLKSNPKADNNVNGYDDPYCRVWTYHKQYSKYSDLIRPFDDDNLNKLDKLLSGFTQPHREILKTLGTKENGLVTIAPNKDDNIKRCMFSIENLAWKGEELLDDYQRGPNNGRIMWFPPYGLTFNENVNTNWNSNQFIGRGEKIYSYVDTERSGNLSFQMLIDHPSLLNVLHNVTDTVGDVDDVDSYEQQVLRFFAGCDIFDKPFKEDNDEKEDIQKENETSISTGVEEKSIIFNVYFPNYYSGKDETPSDAINYLLRGIGCQNVYGGDYYLTENRRDRVGGYEMEEKYGLSCVDKWANQPTSAITEIYHVIKTASIDVHGPWKVMAKTVKRDDSDTNYWGYKVDTNYEKNKLSQDNNYLDTHSFKLNNTTPSSNSDSVYCSFAEFVNSMDSVKNSETNTIGVVSKMLDEYSVDKVVLDGYSTSHGNSDENYQLASNRVDTIKKWLQTISKFNNVTFETHKYSDMEVRDNDVNSRDAKEKRRVTVTINLKKETIVNLGPTTKQKLRNDLNNDDHSQVQNVISDLSEEYKTKLETLKNVMYNRKGKDGGRKINNNEYEFFDALNRDSNILRNKIVDKIKYFDPAYHSITPEGFNNRLTFLHQCTRQGSTNSATNSEGKNLRNLSFGTPPICVLRIGDFFNTKIIIESLNISYDEASWDLNDEGIGVMPMFAKIDINFKFIGGSDLSGPISRLQNAVSFNYYANTRVFDNNSNKNGEI